MQQTLFDNNENLSPLDEINAPLASKLRPQTLDEYVGQQHLLSKGKVLERMITSDKIPSMIFWGPPGVGKTTLARIIALKTQSEFIDFSAVTSGIKEIREVMSKAEHSRRMGLKTILFIDEIHRFNKAQQDAFLPFVEKGSIVLIGATTENPSFEVNSALLSRCKVFVLNMLSCDDLVTLLKNTLKNPKAFGNIEVEISDEMLKMVATFANGDARTALSTLEMLITNSDIQDEKTIVSEEILKQCINKRSLLYDKGGEEHFNIISALHKSMRNSDVQASIYWLARMLEGGEEPLYIARRLIRFASEDVGLADTNALSMAVAVYKACHFIGMPECSVHLTHAVTYLSIAPKSNALYMAYGAAQKDANKSLAEPVPLHLRNAVTKLMKDLNYSKGYKYAHDYEDKKTDMECLPENLKGRKYYNPTSQGKEAKIKEWLTNN
ncbi:MAG: replication-associated recombination protein A [Oscillospiraceae bacterium]|nr:replication-associated recombination protein A [Oscillospiraceae bacterium]